MAGSPTALPSNSKLPNHQYGAEGCFGYFEAKLADLGQGLTVSFRDDTNRAGLGGEWDCDELFFAGTATEVMPIRSLDRITIGADGRRGPITERIQSAFHDIVHGRVPDRFGWLSPVDS